MSRLGHASRHGFRSNHTYLHTYLPTTTYYYHGPTTYYYPPTTYYYLLLVKKNLRGNIRSSGSSQSKLLTWTLNSVIIHVYIFFLSSLLRFSQRLCTCIYIYIRMHGCIKHGCKHMRVVLNYGAWKYPLGRTCANLARFLRDHGLIVVLVWGRIRAHFTCMYTNLRLRKSWAALATCAMQVLSKWNVAQVPPFKQITCGF